MHCMRDKQIRYMTTGLFLTAVLISGCSMISGSQSLHQSAKGSVYLEEVSEWSFEANHPTIIDQNTMLKIVKGVMTEEAASASTRMPASGSKPMRVFSDGDAEFLAPLLAQGLCERNRSKLSVSVCLHRQGQALHPPRAPFTCNMGRPISPSRLPRG
jgi:hypothetical protein